MVSELSLLSNQKSKYVGRDLRIVPDKRQGTEIPPYSTYNKEDFLL
ncbi:MAG: hypothetical protein AB1546_12785 [bacterium]